MSADDVAIEQGVELGISTTPDSRGVAVGYVRAIGTGVTEWVVDDIVLIDNYQSFIDSANIGFLVTDKSNVRLKYTTPP
jgi:hypothetical protein